jgi:hypothetical protein
MLMPDMRNDTPGNDTPESLVFDLVEWVAKEPRTYRQVMDAWRTSCPRLTVWEEALERGYLVRKGTDVTVTEAGHAFLRQRSPDGVT